RVRGFDHDISAEIGDFPAVVLFPQVSVFEWLVQAEGCLVDGRDDALLRAGQSGVALLRGRDDDAVADPPAGNLLVERDAASAVSRRGSEADPGSRHRRAMEVHASAAGDDGR